MNPLSMSAHLGLPQQEQKPTAGKPTPTKGAKKRPGRGKPGASHLAQLTQAHGAGNFAQAKTHALNYAKAVHQHMSGIGGSAPMPMSEPDADDVSVDAGQTPQPTQPANTAGASGGVSRLISLMRKRSA